MAETVTSVFGGHSDPHAARHRCIAQPQPLFEPKHFLDPPHRHLRSWHLPAPPKGGGGTRHYLPLSSEARADQGCRKRRNQVPDWSEIPCRFPPKSPAAFDRNQVPVCSDFCMPDRTPGPEKGEFGWVYTGSEVRRAHPSGDRETGPSRGISSIRGPTARWHQKKRASNQ